MSFLKGYDKDLVKESESRRVYWLFNAFFLFSRKGVTDKQKETKAGKTDSFPILHSFASYISFALLKIYLGKIILYFV